MSEKSVGSLEKAVKSPPSAKKTARERALDPEEQKQISELVARIRAGDDEALRELIEKFEPLKKRITEHFKSSPLLKNTDMNDLLQDANIAISKAAMKFDTARGFVTFGAYVKTSINNKMITLVRRETRKMRKQDPGDVLSEKKRTTLEKQKFREKKVSDEKKFYEETMKRADSHLTEKERKIFVYRMENGASYKEIAEKMGCSVKTVDNALIRAKKKLRLFALTEEKDGGK